MDFSEAERLIRPVFEPYDIDDVELQKMALLMGCVSNPENKNPLRPEIVDRLAQYASNDALAFDVAIVLAVDGLRKGWSLPQYFREFIAGVLDGSVPRPTKRGPKSEALQLRNIRICAAVEMLCDRGTTLEEAYDHVSNVVHKSPDTIKELWKKRDSNRDNLARIIFGG